MENYDAKAVFRKYTVQYRLCIIPVLLAAFLPYFFHKNENILLLSVTAVLIIRVIVIQILFKKHIYSVLLDELDPVKYTAVLDAGRIFSIHATERLLAAYYSGDYQSVINICSKKIVENKSKLYRNHYRLFLARVYFDSGDYDRLRMITEEFDNAARSDKNSERIRARFPVMRAFKLFGDGDFIAFREYFKKTLDDPHVNSSRLPHMQVRYMYAVSCYLAGDIQTAKQYFEYITNKAPLLNLAALSQKYLNAIAADTEYTPNTVKLFPESGYTLPYNGKRQRIFRVLVIMSLAFLLLSILLDFSN